MWRRPFPIRVNWMALIIFPLLAAIVDGYLLTRAYASENANSVSIVATGHYGVQPRDGAGLLVTPPSVQPVVRLQYTGDLAHRIQRLFLAPPNRYDGCTPGKSDTVYIYTYVLTFSIDGVAVERAQADTGECFWGITALGVPYGILPGEPLFGDGGNVLANAINALTHGAFPTPDHPVYA